MTKVILLAQGLDDSLIARNLRLFNEPREVTLLSDSNAAWPYTTISIGSRPLESLKIAALESNSERLLILDAALTLDTDQLQKLLKAANDNVAISCFPLQIGSQSVNLVESTANAIWQQISLDQAWPIAAVALDAGIISELEETGALSLREIIAQVVVMQAAEGVQISATKTVISSNSELALARTHLDSAERARLLALTLDRFNIEEIFPEHNWSEFEAESAAACYHSFAALFIKLGDAESANACLQLSENFEDSPRSLALRAIIARERGEILGAVANMVSSLQQYELRKEKNVSHYLNFKPGNIEVISESLKSGLAALNKRNNESALQYFTAAVLNFDKFYQELGVDQIATRDLAVYSE